MEPPSATLNRTASTGRARGTVGARWPGALAAELRANLIGDLLLQILVAALWYWHLRSGWLVVVWVLRWVVIAGIFGAMVALRSRRRERAIAVLVGGHLFGVITTVAVVPEVVPLTMFIVVGDLLLLARYTWRRTMAVLVASLVAAVVCLLSLEHWTRLAARAPRGMFIAFIVGHAVGTGWFHATASSRSRRELLEDNASLAATRRRVAIAGLEQRDQIAAALTSGPIDALARLRRSIAPLVQRGTPAADRIAAEAAVQDAQTISTQLRELAHGVYPDALRQHGVESALKGLRRGMVEVRATFHGTTLDADTGTAVYFISAAIMDAFPEATGVHLTVEQERHRVVLQVEVRRPPGAPATVTAVERWVAGRLHAANADAGVRTHGTDVVVTVNIPLGGGVPDVPAPHRARIEARRFVRLALASALAAFAVAVALRSGPALVSAGCTLALAAVARLWLRWRGSRPMMAIAVVAVATYGAAAASTVAAPAALPVASLVVMVPALLALERLPARVLAVLTVVQSLIGGVIALAGLLRTPSQQLQGLPLAAVVVALPLAATIVIIGIVSILTTTHAQLVEQTEQLRQSHARLVEVSDSERRSIERDLHDGGQQQVVAIALQLRALARSTDQPAKARALAADLDAHIATAITDLRALVAGAAPEGLHHGLAAALRQKLLPSAIPVGLVDELDGDVDPDAALAAYYCCLEAAQNALKHAQPSRIDIRLRTTPSHLVFQVDDDGVGFDPTITVSGNGLRNLSQRLEVLNGELTVHSAPGGGTTLVGALPRGRGSGSR